MSSWGNRCRYSLPNTSAMSDIAIKIENLGKRYRYGGVAHVSDNFRADLMEWAKGLWPRRNRKPETGDLKSEPQVSGLPSHPSPASSPQVSSLKSQHSSFREVHEKHIAEDPNYFWALRDINLEIKQGEVVGIIGRNGAGKSTLLKVLSRITPPTTGKITYNGRIASLLEVGTGFHRELTGRENIFLNGSILGMKRAEIARKFDEIVAFAEVEKFIDTPVKFYSSGMYVRLAFSVAAHLEPEILVVDEVLAVGDASFQKKCLGKMDDVAKQGRTILLVSHNMTAVSSLCTRAIYLKGGRVSASGVPDHTIDRYLSDGQTIGLSPLSDRLDRAGSGELRLTQIDIADSGTNEVSTVRSGQNVNMVLRFETHSPQPVRRVSFEIGVYNHLDQLVFLCGDDFSGSPSETLPRQGMAICRVRRLPLPPGTYRLNIYCGRHGKVVDWIRDAAVLSVAEGDFFGTGRFPSGYGGLVFVDQQWEIREAHV